MNYAGTSVIFPWGCAEFQDNRARVTLYPGIYIYIVLMSMPIMVWDEKADTVEYEEDPCASVSIRGGVLMSRMVVVV